MNVDYCNYQIIREDIFCRRLEGRKVTETAEKSISNTLVKGNVAVLPSLSSVTGLGACERNDTRCFSEKNPLTGSNTLFGHV